MALSALIVKHRTEVTALAVLLCAMLLVNLGMNHVPFNNPRDQVRFGQEKSKPAIIAAGYQRLAEAEPDNIGYHYHYIHAFFQQETGWYDNDDHWVLRDDEAIAIKYTDLTLHPDEKNRTIGYFGAACIRIEKEDYEGALITLSNLNDPRLPYVSFLRAEAEAGLGMAQKAEASLRHEISLDNGYRSGAAEALAIHYYRHDLIHDFYALLADKELGRHAPLHLVKQVHFEEGRYADYYISLFAIMGERINSVGVAAAFLVMLTWLFFLIRVDVYEKEHPFNLALTLALGMAFSLFTFFIDDSLGLHFNAGLNGEWMNDFFYSVFGIGLVEEVVKIIPLLLMMMRRNVVNTPFDYILYASVSALGFAFVENLLYYDGTHLNIIHARAMTSVVGHMFDSSIVAYGLILARYKWKNVPGWTAFIAFLLLAALAHGLYDFWIFSGALLIFILFFLASVRLWITFIKNALNQSPHFTYDLGIHAGSMRYFLVVSLTAILAFEYATIGWEWGAGTANDMIGRAFLTGSFMIFILGSRLSSINLAKGYWNPLRLGLFPAHPAAIRTENLVGLAVRLRAWPRNKAMERAMQGEVSGRITDRLPLEEAGDWPYNVKRRTGGVHWLLVKLDRDLDLPGYCRDHVFVKFIRTANVRDQELAVFEGMVINDLATVQEGKTGGYRTMGWVLVEEVVGVGS